MKKLLVTFALITSAIFLNACSQKSLEAAQVAVKTYNEVATSYNESIAPYNEAVNLNVRSNQSLDEAINSAQAIINAGEEPFDPETLTSLKSAISDAQETKVEPPELFDIYEGLALNEDIKNNELKAFTEKVKSDIVIIEALVIPNTPSKPDYSDEISAIITAQRKYEDSIQSLKQVTSPTDDFVISRLQTIDTIIEIKAVTEDHDPNGQLNKQGGYIGCVYFSDSQVDKSQLYIESNKDSVIDIGTEGGGAIEIFANKEDANKRNDYLATFDGTIFASGGHYVIGTIIIRTSDQLTGTQQLELTEKITNALIEVKH